MKKIQIGRLVNTHGLKGEVKVLSESDFKNERFARGMKLYINDLAVTVKSYRTHKNFDLLTFEEFSDINDVEKYKGSLLYITDDNLGHLEDNEYYYFDLEGMKVSDGETVIGTVLEVRENPGNDLLVVKTSDKIVLIPFVEEIVADVDEEARLITINAIEGLL